MKIDLLDILLRNNRILRAEFNELFDQMENDPIGFILNEENPGIAKKKNIIKSIFQILYPYRNSNYVVNKLENDHISMIFLGVAAGGYAVSQGSRPGGSFFIQETREFMLIQVFLPLETAGITQCAPEKIWTLF